MKDDKEKLFNDICELLGDATVFDADDHVVWISCHEWKWSYDHKLNCLTYSPDNAKRLASVLQAIARNNRREVDVYKPPVEGKR